MNKKFDWTTEKSEYIFSDKWITLRKDTCTMPNGQVVDPYYVLEFSNWVNIVAVTEKQEVILVRQFRHGIGKTALELPAGMVEKEDTSTLESIRRELLEETGYESDHIIETGKISPNPANQNNWQYCFLATNCKKVAKQDLDETEQIDVVLKPLDALPSLIESGEIIQSLNVSSIYLALRALDKLKVQ